MWFQASNSDRAHPSSQVGRLTNPLGTPITSPLVFGSHLLTLTEDGRNLLTWDVPEEGTGVYYLCKNCAEYLRSTPQSDSI